MAASSPAKSNSGATDGASTTPSSKSLRGLNKPKCIKCGNVARSRCPYQSCKNCCAKAQNPCHIHVLKGSTSFPDNKPSSSSPLFDQQSTEVSHTGNSHRLRQLSNNFAQFNNLQTPFRTRKPLTKKDAQIINEWRFLKLKEFRDRNIEAESEAFDRYMQNVGLLEEVFLVNSEFDDQGEDDELSSKVNSSSDGESTSRMVHGLKLKLGSNVVRSDNLRKRIQYIVDQGLKKVEKVELIDGTGELSDNGGERAAKKLKSSRVEKAIALSDLSDKLNKARNEDDLKSCWEMGCQIFRWNNTKTSQTGPGEVLPNSEEDPEKEVCSEERSYIFPPKMFNPADVGQEVLCRIDAQFSSLKDIIDL